MSKCNFIKILLFIVPIVFLTSCGQGTCNTNLNNNSPQTSGNLSFIAPIAYPAGVAVDIPLIIKNNSAVQINNIQYNLDTSNNSTGANITITEASAKNCLNIPAYKSCQLTAHIAAIPASQPGSFSVKASWDDNSSKSIFAKSSNQLIIKANIGLVDLPSNNGYGANGITIFAPNTILGTSSGTSQMIVTAVITSENAGNFNNIFLVDQNGNRLNYSILTSNIGTGMTNLIPGSIVSFLVDIPPGSTGIFLKTQTAVDNSVINTSSNPVYTSVTNPSKPTGIAQISPPSFNLTPTHDTQVMTIINSGNGPITNLKISPDTPITLVNNSCKSTLAVGETCTYTIKFDKTQPIAGTTGINTSYSNGSEQTSATNTINYDGIDPIYGLSLSGASDTSFVSTTNTPTTQKLITISNQGETNATGVSFNFDHPELFSTDTTGLTNPCLPSTALVPGGTCNILINYQNNQETTGMQNENLKINFSYGQGKPVATETIPLTYETIRSEASLSAPSSTVAFDSTLMRDNTESIIKTFVITNNNDQDATNLNFSFSGGDSNLFSTSSTSTTCTSTLAAGESCIVAVKFGPTGPSTATGIKNAQLDIGYTTYPGGPTVTLPIDVTGEVTSTQSAILSIAQTSQSGFAGGDGTNETPFMIQNNAASPTLTFTVTNSGDVPADNLYITNNIAGNWNLTSNSCGTVNSKVTLGSNGSCLLTYTLSPNTVQTDNIDFSTIGSLTANWEDQANAGGTSTNLLMADPVYVTVYQAASISLSSNLVTPNNIIPGESFIVTISLSNGYKVPAQPILIAGASQSALATAGISTAIESGNCTLQSANSPQRNQCKFTFTAGLNTPVGNYNAIFNNSGNLAFTGSVPFQVVNILSSVITGNTKPGESFTITYTNLTNSPQDINVTLPPGFIPSPSSSCSLVPLTGTCSINVTIPNNIPAGEYPIQATTQSGATQVSNANIYVSTLTRKLYIPNSVSSGVKITLCDVESSQGTVTNCVNSGATVTGLAYGITVNTTGTKAYISDSTLGSSSIGSGITQCNINQSSGALSGCVYTRLTVLTDSLRNLIISKNQKYLYTDNYNGNDVVKCNLNSDGTINASQCTNQGLNLSGFVERLALTPDGSSVYVNTTAQGFGTRLCSINQANGAITGCSSSGYTGPTIGLRTNLAQTRMYFTNFSPFSGGGYIAFCPINSNFTLGTCSSAGFYLSSHPTAITFTEAGFAYISDFQGNNGQYYLSKCSVDAVTGALTGCVNQNAATYSVAPRPEDVEFFN